jgi:hypothetical protein
MGESDRVRVPTNGHRPPLGADAERGDAAPAVPDPVVETELPDPRLVISPTQLAAGFGILAGLIVLLARRRGRRGDRDDEA